LSNNDEKFRQMSMINPDISILVKMLGREEQLKILCED